VHASSNLLVGKVTRASRDAIVKTPSSACYRLQACVTDLAEMKFHKIVTIASVASLVAAGVPLSTGAMTDQTELRSIADAELSAVTGENQANIFFSPVEDGDEPNFPKVVQYQRKYMAGRQSFDEAKYSDALQHLRKVDEIIRSYRSWTAYR
jgi:hypothetical protein